MRGNTLHDSQSLNRWGRRWASVCGEFQEKVGLKALMPGWEEMTNSEVQGWPFQFWFGFKTKAKLCSEIRNWPVRHRLNLLSSKLGLSMVVICFYFPPPMYLLICLNAVCVCMCMYGRVRGRREFLSSSHSAGTLWNPSEPYGSVQETVD